MTHTPTPWAIRPSSSPMNSEAFRSIVSEGSQFAPQFIGEVFEEDAAYLVRAVNNHASLVEALDAIPKECEHTWPHLMACWCCKAKHALAQATEIVTTDNDYQPMRHALWEIITKPGRASISGGVITFENGTFLDINTVLARCPGQALAQAKGQPS